MAPQAQHTLEEACKQDREYTNFTKSLTKSTFSAATWSVDWFRRCSPMCRIFVFDQFI